MSGEWGPWIEHDGRGVPVEVMGREIEVWWRPEDGDEQNWRHAVLVVDDLAASCSSWHAAKYEGRGCMQHWAGEQFLCGPYWVDHYRIRKPRGLVICENLLADLPEKVDA
jgi:hypothetical protein